MLYNVHVQYKYNQVSGVHGEVPVLHQKWVVIPKPVLMTTPIPELLQARDFNISSIASSRM